MHPDPLTPPKPEETIQDLNCNPVYNKNAHRQTHSNIEHVRFSRQISPPTHITFQRRNNSIFPKREDRCKGGSSKRDKKALVSQIKTLNIPRCTRHFVLSFRLSIIPASRPQFHMLYCLQTSTILLQQQKKRPAFPLRVKKVNLTKLCLHIFSDHSNQKSYYTYHSEQ